MKDWNFEILKFNKVEWALNYFLLIAKIFWNLWKGLRDFNAKNYELRRGKESKLFVELLQQIDDFNRRKDRKDEIVFIDLKQFSPTWAKTSNEILQEGR